MKRAGKILLCLASGLACNVVAAADDAALPNNPYAALVTRNVFGLNPPAAPAAPAPADPPPKITPNGILSILGRSQVLFKVADSKPGQAAKDLSYNLSEGQSQDDIAVTSIDEKDGIVTFNNHGTVQVLPLIPTAASGGSAPAPAPATVGGIRMPGGRIPPPAAMMNDGGGGNGVFGGRNPNSGNGGNFRPQSQETLTPEAQVILMEANRVATQDLVDQGKMPPLPPTALTPDEVKQNLIAPPMPP